LSFPTLSEHLTSKTTGLNVADVFRGEDGWQCFALSARENPSSAGVCVADPRKSVKFSLTAFRETSRCRLYLHIVSTASVRSDPDSINFIAISRLYSSWHAGCSI